MNKQSIIKNLENAAFIENNGKVIKMLTVLEHSYHELAPLKRVLKLQGVDEAEFIESVNFLARAGYIELRDIESKTAANLADWQYENLEAILTDKGLRLIKNGIKDNMIEV